MQRVRSLASSTLLLMGIAFLAVALATTLQIGFARPALAHAAYVSSVPAADSHQTAAPATVTITFAQNLDPKGLAIAIYDQTGKVVSTGTAQISSSDPATASIAMKGDDSEIYRVDWQTVSAVDGDATLGAFTFGIGDTDKVTTATTPKSATNASGVSPGIAVLTGVLGLVLGAAGTFFVLRNRSAATA